MRAERNSEQSGVAGLARLSRYWSLDWLLRSVLLALLVAGRERDCVVLFLLIEQTAGYMYEGEIRGIIAIVNSFFCFVFFQGSVLMNAARGLSERISEREQHLRWCKAQVRQGKGSGNRVLESQVDR